jgi:hypothetical protein
MNVLFSFEMVCNRRGCIYVVRAVVESTIGRRSGSGSLLVSITYPAVLAGVQVR